MQFHLLGTTEETSDAKAVEFHNVNTLVNNKFNVNADAIKFWNSTIHTQNEINLNVI